MPVRMNSIRWFSSPWFMCSFKHFQHCCLKGQVIIEVLFFCLLLMSNSFSHKSIRNTTLLLFSLVWLFNLLCACVHAQSYLTLCDPVDCSPPGFSVYGILQARILEQVDISSSRPPCPSPTPRVHSNPCPSSQ